eukprot:Nk52_evm2s165 gene=Nk52_evmTU2s165
MDVQLDMDPRKLALLVHYSDKAGGQLRQGTRGGSNAGPHKVDLVLLADVAVFNDETHFMHKEVPVPVPAHVEGGEEGTLQKGCGFSESSKEELRQQLYYSRVGEMCTRVYETSVDINEKETASSSSSAITSRPKVTFGFPLTPFEEDYDDPISFALDTPMGVRGYVRVSLYFRDLTTTPASTGGNEQEFQLFGVWYLSVEGSLEQLRVADLVDVNRIPFYPIQTAQNYVTEVAEKMHFDSALTAGADVDVGDELRVGVHHKEACGTSSVKEMEVLYAKRLNADTQGSDSTGHSICKVERIVGEDMERCFLFLGEEELRSPHSGDTTTTSPEKQRRGSISRKKPEKEKGKFESNRAICVDFINSLAQSINEHGEAQGADSNNSEPNSALSKAIALAKKLVAPFMKRYKGDADKKQEEEEKEEGVEEFEEEDEPDDIDWEDDFLFLRYRTTANSPASAPSTATVETHEGVTNENEWEEKRKAKWSQGIGILSKKLSSGLQTAGRGLVVSIGNTIAEGIMMVNHLLAHVAGVKLDEVYKS